MVKFTKQSILEELRNEFADFDFKFDGNELIINEYPTNITYFDNKNQNLDPNLQDEVNFTILGTMKDKVRSFLKLK